MNNTIVNNAATNDIEYRVNISPERGTDPVAGFKSVLTCAQLPYTDIDSITIFLTVNGNVFDQRLLVPLQFAGGTTSPFSYTNAEIISHEIRNQVIDIHYQIICKDTRVFTTEVSRFYVGIRHPVICARKFDLKNNVWRVTFSSPHEAVSFPEHSVYLKYAVNQNINIELPFPEFSIQSKGCTEFVVPVSPRTGAAVKPPIMFSEEANARYVITLS